MPIIKQGLDSFPLEVGVFNDSKLRRVRLKYGYLGIMVYIELLTLLYSDKGYYIPYGTEKEREDCIWYISDGLAGKYAPNKETIERVIEELVACELFSGDHFPEIITSKRSQAVYYSATVERKSVVIDADKWLLSLDEMKKLSKKHSYYLSLDNRPIIEDNRPIIEDNRPIIPEKREIRKKEKINKENKKSGVKEIKEIISKETKEYIRTKERKEIDNINSAGAHVREEPTYEQVMDDMVLEPEVKPIMFSFIKHCALNGHKITNDKLTNILVYMDLRRYDAQAKIDTLQAAINGGYYDIRRQ